MCPLPEPIVDLDCEFKPSTGGRLVLSWPQGPDAWSSGSLELTDDGSVVEFNTETVEVGMLTVVPTSRVTSAALERDDLVVLRFKNDAGCASPPFQPCCFCRQRASWFL